jgi:hypothetical protein
LIRALLKDPETPLVPRLRDFFFIACKIDKSNLAVSIHLLRAYSGRAKSSNSPLVVELLTTDEN